MRVEAQSIGPIAKRALQRSHSAKVLACFDHSFYLEMDAGLVCVADACLYNGPLNLLVQMERRSDRRFGALTSLGQRWAVDDGCDLRSDDGSISISLLTSSVWQPNPARLPWPESANVSDGLELLRGLIAARPCPKGLVDVALDQTSEARSSVDRAALAPIRAMQRETRVWLESDGIGLAEPMSGLLGLGPGLTPSGDDLIAGFLIAAHHIGHGDAALALWKMLEGSAKHQTNRISAAHLAAAAVGFGAAPLHDLLDAISKSSVEQMEKALDGIEQIGHSSGWDAVAGVMLLLGSWIETNKRQAIAA